MNELQKLLRPGWLGIEHIPLESVTKLASDMAAGLKTAEIPPLVRFAFDQPNSDVADRVVEVFNVGDPVVQQDEVLRQQLLAAATLFVLLTGYTGESVVVAGLCVSTLNFGRSTTQHVELLQVAKSHLQTASDASQVPPAAPRAPAQSSAAKEAFEALATADFGVYRTAIVELSNELTKMRQAYSRYSAWVERREAPLRTQLELLWWLTSGVTASTAQNWTHIPSHAAPVIAALDIATLSPQAPGPPSSRGLLSLALGAAGTGTSRQIDMNAARLEVAELRPDNLPVPTPRDQDLYPVLYRLTDNGYELPEQSETALAVAEEALLEIYLYRMISSSNE